MINEYKYDINKNISSLKTYVENGSVFTENSYKYDLNGNQVEKLENGVKTTYEYDTIQQISKVSYGNGSKVESFAYDNVGKRLERTIETGSVLTKYPFIDKIDDQGVATRIKSRDLNAPSYQNSKKLENTITNDINKLDKFNGLDRTWGSTQSTKGKINSKVLEVVVPDTKLSTEQVNAINNAIGYGQGKNITANIIVGK